MNKLDILVEMRAEMDALERQHGEMSEGWQRRRLLLSEAEILLRRVMEYPETWDISSTISQLVVRIREEIGADELHA